jgi:Alw26I/Eco31I/Esp3I family type II restriction m6 adenine DNA methyltransferase
MDAILSNALNSTTSYAGKTLAERVAGRFYTPDLLAIDLANRLADLVEARSRRGELASDVRVCDPFCGDGRLIAALLAEVSRRPALRSLRWKTTLRDVERAAALSAGRLVTETASAFNLEVEVRVVIGDSFAEENTELQDVVVTNPPWELLKPDSRELGQFSQRARSLHLRNLRDLCDALDSKFPNARADKAWGGWGTHLARCGWELALRSCASGGALGIILPSTILADQVSANMRRWALTHSLLVDLATYPPEARLFARVDQPVVAATFISKPNTRGLDATLRVFDANSTVRVAQRLKVSESELADRDYVLPVGFAAEALDLLAQLANFPPLSDLEGIEPTQLWAGRELDETRISEKLVPGKRYPFVKGRMIQRHAIVEKPSRSVRSSLARGARSIDFERIVWRDVSRGSQARRMICALIPSGWLAGNSLHVAHFRDGNPIRLRSLYAILSSLVLEFQVRARLATGHMSLGVVRGARIPLISGQTMIELAEAADHALLTGQDARLEVVVARAYGLSREQLAELISHFPKIIAERREAILSSELWQSA